MPRPTQAYATYSDVLRHLPYFGGTFLASPAQRHVSVSQANSFLLSAADELDGSLSGQGYPVPVTATQALPLLSLWNSIGAAMYIAAADPRGDKGSHLKFLTERWTSLIKMLDSGQATIPGLDRDDSVELPRYPDANACGASPYFVREMREML